MTRWYPDWRLPLWSVLIALLGCGGAGAWDYVHFPVDVSAPESEWRETLAAWVDGEQEVAVEGGRVDVLTEESAIEVDRVSKWHEGLGQVLHYSEDTRRSGVLALMAGVESPRQLHPKQQVLLTLIERHCDRLGVRLVVMFPGAATASETFLVHEAEAPGDYPVFWLNETSGVRHNMTCRYFEATVRGRACRQADGHACSQCGG